MKLGVFSVSMPDYDPMQTLEKLAELGYDGVEWRVTDDKGDRAKPSFWSGNRTSMTAAELTALAPKLVAKAAELNLAMPALGAYIDCADAAVVEEHLRAGAAIGAKNVRVSAGRYDPARGSYPAQVQAARAHYAVVAGLARQHGVRAVIETHMGQLAPSMSKAMNILRDLDPKHVGIMWDPGNQVVEGREVYSMALEIAGEYLAEVHAKNMRFEAGETKDGRTVWKSVACPLREGQADWPEIIAALKRFGYDGWIHFEDFSTERPLDERLRDNLAWFREMTE